MKLHLVLDVPGRLDRFPRRIPGIWLPGYAQGKTRHTSPAFPYGQHLVERDLEPTLDEVTLCDLAGEIELEVDPFSLRKLILGSR